MGDPVGRYTLMVNQMAALGITTMVDFGPSYGEEDAYVELMRAVAPHAQAKGVQISMKLHHAAQNGASIMSEQVATHDAVNHPAFGLCMDPGSHSLLDLCSLAP